MKILDTWRASFVAEGIMSPWLLNEKSYRRVRNDLPVRLSPWNTLPGTSFVSPACPPARTSAPRSWHYPGATDPVAVYPPKADSAERSETIKSTAESTLPCKLAHCQAQRFTVTGIAYTYISSTHTFTTITDCHRSIYREIWHCCYMVLLSHRICVHGHFAKIT